MSSFSLNYLYCFDLFKIFVCICYSLLVNIYPINVGSHFQNIFYIPAFTATNIQYFGILWNMGY